MEAAGVIEGYAAILSEKALGRSATVFVAVTLENQRSETMAAFERAVARCREVQDCHLMTGESDYLLRIVLADDDRYERVHQETLSKLPGVRRLVSNFTIRTVFRRAASIAH
jgi:DNA-binding Lrp family transcriptional regulator